MDILIEAEIAARFLVIKLIKDAGDFRESFRWLSETNFIPLCYTNVNTFLGIFFSDPDSAAQSEAQILYA